jgi:glycosyltransferase involved in cell wall biosynthesis
LTAFENPEISWQSGLDDLTPLYENARVFAAPTRYAAGISLKVIEAAARGVPIVCTTLVAGQLGWRPGVEVVTADNADEIAGAIALLFADRELWMRLREEALKRVLNDYSFAAFRAALAGALACQRAETSIAGVR